VQRKFTVDIVEGLSYTRWYKTTTTTTLANVSQSSFHRTTLPMTLPNA